MDNNVCELPEEEIEGGQYVPHIYDKDEAARLISKARAIKNQTEAIAALEDAMCELDRSISNE